MGNIQGYVERLDMGQMSNPSFNGVEEKDVLNINGDDADGFIFVIFFILYIFLSIFCL